MIRYVDFCTSVKSVNFIYQCLHIYCLNVSFENVSNKEKNYFYKKT